MLNYIPFIGPFVATILPTLFAVAQFDASQNAILVFAALNLIQFLVGSYLEPLIAGKVLSMSPFLVLFAVFFLDVPVGDFRCVHRYSHRDRHADTLRAAPVEPLGSGVVRGTGGRAGVIGGPLAGGG